MTKPFLKSAVLNPSGARRGRTPRKHCDGTNAAALEHKASSMGDIIDLQRRVVLVSKTQLQPSRLRRQTPDIVAHQMR